MKKKLLILLPAMFALAACGTSQPSTTSKAPEPSSEASQSSLSLRGYSLKKDRDSTKAATYKLEDVITLETLTSITQLSFASSNEEIATVSAAGLITRKDYGSVSIRIGVAAEPTSIWKITTFQLTFEPEDAQLLGKYSNLLDAPEGKTEVRASIVLKENNTFDLTYTTGTVLDTDGEGGRAEYNITAQTVTGTYTSDSLYKFTVTTDSFAYKKTFSGQIVFNEGVPALRVKIPLAAEKTSRIYYFERDNK
ncbi:MAG: hypothetical protein E7181_02300 [Erysipelotrichaceae bacterium]|nr:hypothetical protein [Erysipelotrichaceae bacterium]